MSASSNPFVDPRELRRQRREQRRAMRGHCDSLAHAVRGPVTLMTVGALFALNNFTPYGFEKTWPVILIVFGLLTLVGRSMSPPPPVNAYPQAAPPPDYVPPAPGGYRQSGYAQGPAGEPAAPGGTAQGGFGTSAPPRQSDPSQNPPAGGAL